MERGVVHITEPVTAVTSQLPGWARLVRAPNPGPMTLDGTNTWVLRAPGAAAAVVIDPGPHHEEHLTAVAGYGPVAAVMITHAHPDHIAGLARFLELTGAAMRKPADGELAGLAVTGLAVTALPTPGHTADSVSYLVEAGGERAVLTGDTILGRGTAVVAWPDGNLADYLASLEHLATLDGVPALPGHGPALADCAEAAGYYLAHRQARLDQVRAAIAGGATTPTEVVAAVYPDVDASLRPAAEWSVRAQLAYLDPASPDLADLGRAAERESETGSPRLDVP